MIKLNDFKKIWLENNKQLLKSVSTVGESGWYILGQEVQNFEKELIKFYPSNNYCTGCASGLDAIEIALRALDLKKNEIVLTTPISAFATTLAIIRAGGIPAFVDTDKSGQINLDIAEKYFKTNTQVKFFVPVHMYGHAQNLEKLNYLKKKYNLKIVEDCAQAISAYSGQKPVGSIGDITATSFYPTKNLGCLGDGGAILTHNEKLDIVCKNIRNYGQSSKYCHTILGLNSRLDELQAKIMLDVFLPKLNKATKHRQIIAKIYLNGIKNKNINILTKPKYSKSVYHLFPILCYKRDNLKEYLKLNNIESAVHYPIIIPDQKAMKNTPYFVFGNLDISRNIANTELSLPINSTITIEEANTVVSVINKWQP